MTGPEAGKPEPRTHRLVVLLDYEVEDLEGEALARVHSALRDRAVHEPVEGARQVRAWVAAGDPANQAVEAVNPNKEAGDG